MAWCLTVLHSLYVMYRLYPKHVLAPTPLQIHRDPSARDLRKLTLWSPRRRQQPSATQNACYSKNPKLLYLGFWNTCDVLLWYFIQGMVELMWVVWQGLWSLKKWRNWGAFFQASRVWKKIECLAMLGKESLGISRWWSTDNMKHGY